MMAATKQVSACTIDAVIPGREQKRKIDEVNFVARQANPESRARVVCFWIPGPREERVPE
jgi:hypothetical protein